MIAVILLQAHDGRGRGTEYPDPFMPRPVEPFAQKPGPLQSVIQLVAADKHVGQCRIRRVMHPSAELQFLFVEANEVVARGVLHGIMFLEISLQYHLAWRLPAPGATGNLREQLKCTLGSAEIRQAQRYIGSNNPHQSDPMNAVTL